MTVRPPKPRSGKFDLVLWESWKKAKGHRKAVLLGELIDANEGLIHMVVQRQKKFLGGTMNHLEDDEFMTGGMVGLQRAIETFDPEKGAFSTIAAIWIKKYVNEVFERTAMVRTPPNQRMPWQVQKVFRMYAAQHNREPSLDELRAALPEEDKGKCPATEKALAAMKAHTWFHTSLDEQAGGTEDEDVRTTKGAQLVDPSKSAEDILVAQVTKEVIARAFKLLTPTEQMVLTKTVLEGKSCTAVANTLGRHERSVRRMQAAALVKLKEALHQSEKGNHEPDTLDDLEIAEDVGLVDDTPGADSEREFAHLYQPSSNT